MSAVDQLTLGTPPGRAAPHSAARAWFRFLGSELAVIFGRRRNLAGLGVLAVVPIIVAVAVWASSDSGSGGPNFISSIVGNGLFVALAALTIELPLFFPIAIAAISGDAIAGEANIGTLRYLLTVPAGRTRLLTVKYAAIVIFAFAATLLVAVVGSIIGLALFGGGPMTTLSGTQVPFGEAVLRIGLCVAYISVCLAALGALGLFVSTLTEQPIAAMIATVLIAVMMTILTTISQLSWLHPWLLTNWWTAYGDLLRDPMAAEDLQPGLGVALAYAVLFWGLAWARFAGKDITS
jgi:ABC-2 type transport system permease protein